MRRRILEVPDPLLRETAAPVEGDAAAMQDLVIDMFQTMHANAGLGLAATQLGIPRRLIVLELPHDDDDPQSGIRYVLIDPEISASDARDDMVEGCLSLPGYRAMVERATTITVEFTQLDGTRASLDAKGLLAQAVQHEIDHLNGVLFIDHLDSLLEIEQIPPDPLDWDDDDDDDDEEGDDDDDEEGEGDDDEEGEGDDDEEGERDDDEEGEGDDDDDDTEEAEEDDAGQPEAG